MGDSVKFNGGGDLDNGMTVSVYYELDGGTYDDYNLKLGMGDMGNIIILRCIKLRKWC